jgi:hypothetical protein
MTNKIRPGRCFSPSTCKNHGKPENYQEIVKILEEELAKRDHEYKEDV